MSRLSIYERKAAMQYDPTNKIDKIRAWYLQSSIETLPHDNIIELTDNENELRKKLETIFGLLTDPRQSLTPRQVVNKIIKWGMVEERQAYRLVKQAQELFTEQEHIEKSTVKVMQTELRRKTIGLIQKDKTLTSYEKYSLINQQMTRIEKMHQIDEDVPDLSRILELLELPHIELTTDPDALNETEDIEFKEL